jgi:hypothetical protein
MEKNRISEIIGLPAQGDAGIDFNRIIFTAVIQQ